MQPIQPAGGGATGGYSTAGAASVNPSDCASSGASIKSSAAAAGEAGSANSAATANAASAAGANNAVQPTMTTISTTSSSMMIMRDQVGSMLGGIDQRLATNEYLKLLIAAMIMNALLSEDGGGQQSGSQQSSGQGTLSSLEGLAGGRNNALYMSLETSTNTVQIQQQSVRLDSVQAAQSTWQASISDQRASGGQMDVCG